MTTEQPPPRCSSLADLLRHRSAQSPLARAFAFMRDGEKTAAALNHAELDLQAQRIAASLLLDFKPGDRVLLAYASAAEFIGAFFGCLYAGIVPVPARAPSGSTDLEPLQRLAAASGAVGLCCGTAGFNVGHLKQCMPAMMQQLRCLTVTAANLPPRAWRLPDLRPDGLAMLQASTDTNGRQGVLEQTHADVLRRLARAVAPATAAPGACAVGWLPPDDTMGLMVQVLQPLYLGMPSLLMPEAAFLAKPARWLQAISNHRATISGAPDFAYELCVREVSSVDMVGLDLSRWNTAFHADDPMNEETMERFADKFAICGFRRQAPTPYAGTSRRGPQGSKPSAVAPAPHPVPAARPVAEFVAAGA